MKTRLLSVALLAATLIFTGIGTANAFYQIEGKVDIVDLRSGNYNATNSFIYVAPKDSLPGFRWLVTNRIDRCDNLSSDALGDDSTVIFQGSGTCATSGTIRSCSGVVTRCLSYRNR